MLTQRLTIAFMLVTLAAIAVSNSIGGFAFRVAVILPLYYLGVIDADTMRGIVEFSLIG